MFNGLNNKQTNGGVNPQGKLTSAEWNGFINELITELNNRIVSIILNGETKTPTDGVVNLGTIQIDVDSALSTTSNNPVRNSVITNAIDTLRSEKATVTDLQAAVAALNTLQTSMETKIGYQVFENGKIRSYDREGGTLICEVTLSGTSYSVQLSTATPSPLIVLRDAVAAYVDVTPSTMASEIGQESEPFIEDYTWELFVDSGSGSYVSRISGSCRSGQTIRANVKNYLTISTADRPNRVRVTVTGVESGSSKSINFDAIMTTLSLTSNFSWHLPWIEGQAFTIDKLNFSGNLQKTLHVKIDDDDNQEYTQVFSAGTNYVTSTFSYPLTDKFPTGGTTGIHTVEVWMTGDGVETRHYRYNVMCVATEDVGTARLVCLNEVAASAVNYEEQTLFKYAVYGGTSATVTIMVDDNGTVIPIVVGQELAVEAGVQQSYVTSLEIDSETKNMTMSINVASGESGQAVTISVDNSHSYAAVEGATVYINASNRSNDSADRETIINDAPGAAVAEFEGTWGNFAWYKDGWGTDPDGNKCLAVLAGSTLDVPDIALTQAGTSSMTYEFKFRCSNIADYDTPVLSLMDTEEYNPQTTNGIILFPTKIQVLGTTSRVHVGQSVNLFEDSILHVVVVFHRRYANTTYNLCQIYVNGIRQAVFLYDGGENFGTGHLRIGQDSSDFYLYMMRIYEQNDRLSLTGVLEDSGVLTNLLNQLSGNSSDMSRSGVRDDNNIIDDGKIDYEMAKAAGYNCMIIEMQNNADLPDKDHQNGGMSTLRLEYAEHPEWNVTIENAPIDGQGTTSMLYYRWNLRWKLKDAALWTYADGTTGTKKGYLDGGQHPKVSKITAKKNVASSMQGHKMGATAMYDDLYGALGLKATAGLSESARVAVYQYPMLGFQKFSDGSYTFIGLYTIGPDKGDSGTFGYDTKTYPSLLSLEGPNHAPLGTRFLHPWIDAAYDSTKKQETLKFGGEEAWDVDAAPWDSDDSAHEQDMYNLLEQEWKPAYEIAFNCSPFICSLAETGMTLAQLNANAAAWRGQTNILGTRKNECLQLYDGDNIIYWRTRTQQYEVLANFNPFLDLRTHYSLPSNATTADIIAARKRKFTAEARNYWDIDGCCFHEAFCELIGAKDNHAKNTYPFKLKTLAEGGRWSWREDDLDSILATDNNGRSTAHYGIEVGDLTDEGVDIFQGSSSAFWTLINDCFGERVGTMLGNMLSALRTMATDMGIQGNNLHEAVFNMFSYYFWERSAKYFPIMAYAEDSKYTYVDVWKMGVNAGDPERKYNNVFPLDQALGTQLEAEKQWVERRIANICSKYSLGGFTGSDSDGYGSIEFTPVNPFVFNLRPAIEMYPSGNRGGGTNVKGGRTKEGQVCPITASSDGTTTFYIKALDWLTDLGDLSRLALTSRAAGGVVPFAVSGKRLRRLKVGDAENEVLFNATTLAVSGQSVEVVDARNVTSLNSAVSLANCPRLKKAYFDGSGASSLLLPAGSKVDYVTFPSRMTTLFFDNLPLLADENVVIPTAALATINNYYFRNCAHIDAFDLLRRILATEGNSLHFITLIWPGTLEGAAKDLELLQQIAQPYTVEGGTETGYGNVVYENGQISHGTGNANLQGTLHITGFYYNDVLEEVQAAFPNLNIVADESPYIRFEDAEVERICSVTWGNYHEVITVDNGDDTVTVTTNFVRMRNTTVASRTQESVVTRAKTESDVAGTVKVKHGITLAQAALVSSIGTTFQGNTKIRYFDELQYFTISSLNNFNNCSNLVRVSINSPNVSFGYLHCRTKAGCRWNVIRMKTTGFTSTYATDSMSNLTFIFRQNSVVAVQSGMRGFGNIKIYVPDNLVDTYKTSGNWTSYASRIHPISEYTGD